MTQSGTAENTAGNPVRRLLVIVNPTAGRGQSRLLKSVVSELRPLAAEVSIRETTAAGDARRLAAAIEAEEVDAIVVAGGDGTINEAANGLARNSRPPALGVIPLGTANVFAVELGLSRDSGRLARILAQAPAGPVYPGRVGGHHFLMMASVGFDARVVDGVSLAAKRRFGRLAYVWGALIELGRNRPQRYRLRCHGEVYDAAGVIAARGRHYGGGFVIARGADLARPVFQVLAPARGGRAAIAAQALALGLGRFHRLPDLRVLTADRLEIEGATDEPVQADGDVVGRLPARLDIAPRPLMVIGAASPEGSVGGDSEDHR